MHRYNFAVMDMDPDTAAACLREINIVHKDLLTTRSAQTDIDKAAPVREACCQLIGALAEQAAASGHEVQSLQASDRCSLTLQLTSMSHF